MLSPGAANALLKSLEEPPAHVVFILCTTDPQKVLPTIRSRTQHFEFHLLNADELADHVRYVIADAELGLGEDAVEHVVRQGGGSARDALSALDQVSAMGGVVEEAQPVEAILDALAQHDAGAALVAVADATAAGRDPRTLGEVLIGRLRDAFLAVMKAPDRHLPARRPGPGRGAGRAARGAPASPAPSRCSASRWWSWPRSPTRASCSRWRWCASAGPTPTARSTRSSTGSTAWSAAATGRADHGRRAAPRRRRHAPAATPDRAAAADPTGPAAAARDELAKAAARPARAPVKKATARSAAAAARRPPHRVADRTGAPTLAAGAAPAPRCGRAASGVGRRARRASRARRGACSATAASSRPTDGPAVLVGAEGAAARPAGEAPARGGGGAWPPTSVGPSRFAWRSVPRRRPRPPRPPPRPRRRRRSSTCTSSRTRPSAGSGRRAAGRGVPGRGARRGVGGGSPAARPTLRPVSEPADDAASTDDAGAAARRELPDFGAVSPDGLGGLLEQAQSMMAAQQAASEREIEGVAGGGVVRIRTTGTGQVLGVTIDPEVVDPSDVADARGPRRGGDARHERQAARDPARGDGSAGRARRPLRRRLSGRRLRPTGAGADRRAGPPARRRAEVGAADRLPPAEGREGRCPPVGATPSPRPRTG